jgi:hypothetical protein
MDAKGTVRTSTVKAYEDAILDASPCWIESATVKTLIVRVACSCAKRSQCLLYFLAIHSACKHGNLRDLPTGTPNEIWLSHDDLLNAAPVPNP